MKITSIDPLQNRLRIKNTCTQICNSSKNNKIRSQQLDISYVNQEFGKTINCSADLDLAFYFDDLCCTYGLSPWQIRLTEFIPLEVDINIASFLNGLFTYSKCEQRFGK